MSQTLLNPRLTTADLPYQYLLEHRQTIGAMLLGAVKSLSPTHTKVTGKIHKKVNPPSPGLLTAYSKWSQAEQDGMIPPHFVCASLTMPLLSELTAQSPYPLLKVLNQGIRLELHKPLPTNQEIILSGELAEARDDGRRARIQSNITIGTADIPKAISMEAIAAVMINPAKKSAPKPEQKQTIPFKTLRSWQGQAKEGQTFFWLTGDFNPIHTMPLFARYTRFKGCIMHAYGAFAQIFEALKKDHPNIKIIEARFIRPMPLPTPELFIQRSVEKDEQGRYAFRLIDSAGHNYQAGTFSEKT